LVSLANLFHLVLNQIIAIMGSQEEKPKTEELEHEKEKTDPQSVEERQNHDNQEENKEEAKE
jgi:hypothetical protein